MPTRRPSITYATRTRAARALAALLLAACGGGGGDAPTKPTTTTLTVSPTSLTCTAGQTATLAATLSPSSTTATYTFTPSNGNVTVSASGASATVTCVTAGASSIGVSAGGQSATVPVTVNAPPFEVTLRVTPSALTLPVGTSQKITATATTTPAGGNTAVTYTSSAPTVARVDTLGNVTAVSAGTARVTVASVLAPTVTQGVDVTVVSLATTTIAIAPTTAALRVGDSTTLAATPRDQQGNPLTGRTATWQSSNAAVATVTPVANSTSVVVKAVGAGSATVTVTIDGVSIGAPVTVSPSIATIAAWGRAQHVSPFGLIGDTASTYLAVTGLWGSAANNVYATTDDGEIWRFNGTSWGFVRRGGGAYLGIHATGPQDVYAVGNGIISHFDGTNWSDVTVTPGVLLRGVWASPGFTVAVGDRGTILKSNGGNQWTAMASPVNTTLRAVWGTGTTVFAVGDSGVLLQYSGTAASGQWARVATGNTTSFFTGVWASSPSNVFISDWSNSRVLRYDGATFTQVASVAEPFSIFGTSGTDVSVATHSAVTHFDGVSWATTAVMQTQRMYAVWTGAGTWVGGEHGFTGVEPAGNTAFTTLSFHPTWLDVWTASPTFAMVVGAGEATLRWNGATWTPVPTNTRQILINTWGVSPTEVYAVSTAGGILRYDGTAWSPMTVSSVYLDGIWGTAGNNIFAVGDGIYRYNGSAWTTMTRPASLGTSVFYAVHGSGPTNVVAVGENRIIARFDGTTWTAVQSQVGGGFFNAVWVADASTAFIGANDGSIYRLTGSTLTSLGRVSQCTITGMWGTRASDVYATTNCGEVLRYDGATWSVQTSTTVGGFYAVNGLSTGGGWAVGDGALIVRGTGPSSVVLPGQGRGMRAPARGAGGRTSPVLPGSPPASRSRSAGAKQ